MDIKWTDKNTPQNKDLQTKVYKELKRNRIINNNGNLKDVAVNLAKDKTVLDIGICGHTIKATEQEDWLFGKINKVAKRAYGIDIIPEVIEVLKNRGYDCDCIDATSETDLEKRFEYIHAGDVIEHVNDPIKMMEFCKRHLQENGKIAVTTPNPWFIKTIIRTTKQGIGMTNLEHINWITPSNAWEIGRRAGLKLTKYYVSEPGTKWKQYFYFWLPIELKTAVYMYIYEVK